MAEPSTDDDGSHPRPQLRRDGWVSLDGTWRFGYDDAGVGETERWFDPGNTESFDRDIVVPFPPESPASGVHDTGFHPVVWYRRELDSGHLRRGPAGDDDRTLIHFAAVDHRATVWFDGHRVGEHVGGQTPFSVDVTDLLGSSRQEHVLVVRAEDDPCDPAQPRGKQDWQLEPHEIWYHRTTGIWQPVWAETVPALSLVEVAWVPDLTAGCVRAELRTSAPPGAAVAIDIAISCDEATLAESTTHPDGPHADVTLDLRQLRDDTERDRLLWSPDHPVLLDATIALRDAESGQPLDTVDSYLGLREVSVADGRFLLNGEPCYLRSVLDQRYLEDTHLAAADSDALRRDVELIKSMGFNAVRVHQTAPDPRFLHWADRLGLLVWVETANARAFSTAAVELLTREWIDIVRRDRSHPSVVTWVPINESWGVPDIADDPRQQQYSLALATLTRALDPTRPVLSNEGWEHLDSDVLGVHDYTTDPDALRAHYADADAVRETVEGPGPQRRRLILGEVQRRRWAAGRAPLMVTEFGGVSLARGKQSWGYRRVGSAEEYADLVRGLFEALHGCDAVAGFCYTQLIDTAQETNGLLYADHTPKIPIEFIRAFVNP